MSDQFVGTWRLVSFVSHGPDGREVSTYGLRPCGLLMYDGGGRMSVHIVRSDLEPAGAVQANPESLTDAVERYFGYFGRYTVDLRTSIVTHHVDGASTPSVDGTDQRRRFQLQGDHLVLTTFPEQLEGIDVTYVATWERLPLRP